MVRFILLDIEGTTTDIAFVHRVLFPYSAERLADYVTTHRKSAEVQACLHSVKQTVQDEEGREPDGSEMSETEVIDTLLLWICDDRKHTALKQLQGLIWKDGFEKGDYQGHVYEDVPQALECWKQAGIGLGIYSSGSVQAQKLLFAYSVYGDLTPYFSHYFDTTVGGKKEAGSYRQIAQALELPPAEILFLSDVEAELDAAAEAGCQTLQLIREGDLVPGKHPAVSTFSEIQLAALV